MASLHVSPGLVARARRCLCRKAARTEAPADMLVQYVEDAEGVRPCGAGTSALSRPDLVRHAG